MIYNIWYHLIPGFFIIENRKNKTKMFKPLAGASAEGPKARKCEYSIYISMTKSVKMTPFS